MVKKSLRVLIVLLAAAVVLRISAGQMLAQSAIQSHDEPVELPLPDDPLRPFWASNVERYIREFQMRDNTEAGLLLLGNPDSTDTSPPESGNVSSIILLRNGEFEGISREYETRSCDLVDRFRRVTTSSVSSPVAIFASARCLNGRPQLAMTVYRLDKKGRWLECSNGPTGASLPRFDFSPFFHHRSRQVDDPRESEGNSPK